MEKFQLYSARNIFSCAEPLEPLSLEERPCEIMRASDGQIRNQLSQSMVVYEDVQQSCNEAHKLRREMRDASFNVRIRIQAIEDSGVQPMSDAVANIEAEIHKLLQLFQCFSGEPPDKTICNSRVVNYSVSDACMYVLLF